MMMYLRYGGSIKLSLLVIAVLAFSICGFSQPKATVVDTSKKATATVIAGEEYKRGGLWTMLWGKHYRKEWTTPVNVSKLRLDTAYGGLKPIEKGGGRQTRNLRLDAPNKRQYAIRSINKDYGKALPEVAQGTFVESIVKDQMSVAHPYAGFTLGALSDAAKVYSTHPKVAFIGDDAGLGKFREEFKDDMYSLEDRPTNDNAKFYGAKDVLDTEDFLKKIMKDNDHRADATSFARARLFDMLIGDWDRHDDQWKWAEFEKDGKHIYKAIPKDRDQAFSKFDGLLLGFAAGAANLPYLQGFNNTIKDVEGFNLEARPLDMQLLSELTLTQWQNIAKEMQQDVTDAVIENAIKLLPSEVYAISGEELINKLKAHRNDLVKYAEIYYKDLSKEVDIPTSKKSEQIEILGVDDDHIKVSLYDLNKNGDAKKEPYYSRTFNAGETKEIRIYGIDGNDKFVVNGNAGRKILVRLIGGISKDSYDVASSYKGKVNIYDNPDNTFGSGRARKYVSADTSINNYNRKIFKPNSSGIAPKIGYSNEDRFFVGLGYKSKVQQWRKSPFGYKNDLSVLYSVTQKAFRFLYKGTFNEAIGKWNVGLLADYDLVRDAYFLGVGNNTIKFNDTRHYFLYQNKELNLGASVYRTFDSIHTITLSGFYQTVQLLNDVPGNYISQFYYPAHASEFANNQFAGAKLDYDLTKVDNRIVPSKGIKFHAGAEYNHNLKNSNSVTRFSGVAGFYLPVGPLTLAVKAGGATLNGEPEFYQMNKIGGGQTLRGYHRWRFYGKSMFYNQNELQWNFNVKTFLFGGKMGLLALFDNGRVWYPGEVSDQWHTAVGGGLMIAPFKFISITGSYAVSSEDRLFSIRIGHLLK